MKTIPSKTKLTSGVVIVVAVAILILSSFYYIKPGSRGVLVTLGKVANRSFTNGIGVKAPFISRMHTFDVKTLKMENVTATYTKDLQTANIGYVFTYNLIAGNVHALYENVGNDYTNKLLTPNITDAIKDVIGKWQAQDLVANRESARTEIITSVGNKLNKEYFENFTFQIINIDYSDVFEKAIESKVVAEQEALKAANNTKRIEEESRQLIIKAEAEAKAIDIKAQALEKNKSLIDYEAVQKWNGALPTYMLGNSVPFINLGK